MRLKPLGYLSAALLTAVVGVAPAHAQGTYNRYPGEVRAAPNRAFDRAFRDGYNRGRDDARHHRRSGAMLSREFRSGDGGYYRGFGDRDSYRRFYRDAFVRGYDQGYREFAYRR